MEKSIFEQMGGTYYWQGVISCRTSLFQKVSAFGASDGGGISRSTVILYTLRCFPACRSDSESGKRYRTA